MRLLNKFLAGIRKKGVPFFSLGILMTVTACGLLVSATRSFSFKRDMAVMIGTSLPPLRSSVALLSANLQAEQLFMQNELSAREEQASVYVLPQGQQSSRFVKALQEISLAITKDAGGDVTVAEVSFDPQSVEQGDYKTLGVRLRLIGNYRSVSRLLAVLSFSGDMSLRDVLPEAAIDQFLKQVEARFPLSLQSAENFLSLDLLRYAVNADKAEQSMLKDVPLDSISDLRAFLLQSGLAQVRSAFDRIAPRLHDEHLWPLHLVSVKHVQRNADQWNIDLTLYKR